MSQVELFDYGIQTEQSDIRAHVSVVNKAIYVFQTFEGVRAVERNTPPERPAFQDGVNGATAVGWLVKPEWINDLRTLRFHSWPGWPEFSERMTTSQKGDLAVQCVLAAMRLGRFPLWLDTEEDRRENIQLKGTDILLFCRKKIQVKCDWRSGPPPGTGNLFLQRAERNPLRRT